MHDFKAKISLIFAIQSTDYRSLIAAQPHFKRIPMSLIRTSITSILVLLLLCSTGFAQTKLQKRQKKKSNGVTVKGRITQNEKKEFQIDLNEFSCVLNQQVGKKLPEPPVPEDRWPSMTPKQKTDWVRKFEASEQFKHFMARRQKILDAAERFELRIEKNGSFVVYDVPPGDYGLRGRLEKVIDEKNYVFEVFGQLNIAKDVEEVLLDPLTVLATRLTKTGEPVPTVNIKTFDGKATINNKLLAKRNVLVYFWSLNNPDVLKESMSIHQTCADVKSKMPIQLLCICVDSDRKKALKHVIDNKLSERGEWHGYAKDRVHDTVGEFGVRSIPALFLLGSDGKIKMTQWEFRSLNSVPDTDLSKIIVDVLQGKNVPTPVPTSANKNVDENKKQ